MAKRIIALICVAILASSVLSGCGRRINIRTKTADNNIPLSTSSETLAETSAPAIQNETTAENTDDTESTNLIEVEPITYTNSTGTTLYLILTNRTGIDCDIEIGVDFIKDNTVVDSQTGFVFADAKDSVVCKYFLLSEEYDSYDYKVTYSPVSRNIPIDQNLSLEIDKQPDRIVVGLTNNGSTPARSVWFDAFFYKEGKVIYHEYSSCSDKEGEIKPAQKVEKECKNRSKEAYDDVRVFYHGEG